MIPNVGAEAKRKNHRIPQYIACAIVNVGAFCLGNVLGWSSPALVSLQNSGDFPNLTETDLSWIGSLAAMGAAVGAPMAGFCIQKIGRKYTVLMSTLPLILGWLPLAIGNKIWMFYLGRLLTGVGMGSLSLVLPVYLSEISEPEIRGGLVATWDIISNLGILFAYVIGSFTEYRVLSGVCGVIPIFCALLLAHLPESPRYYLAQGSSKKAMEALCWLRASDKKCPSLEVLQEITEMEEAMEKQRDLVKGTIVKDLMSMATLKPLGIVLCLMGFGQLSGGIAFDFYTVMIFNNFGGVSLDSFASGVVFGVGQLLATVLASVYVDKAGRRLLLILSFAVMFILLGALEVFFHFNGMITSNISLDWVPLVTLVLFNAAFTGGVDTLAWVVMGEVLPSKTVGITSGLATTFYWAVAFFVTRFFNDLTGSLGYQNVFWGFTAFCGVGVVFTYFVVPETKGKSLDRIQEEHFVSKGEK